ncbi:MAG: hypothetical protein E7638_01415 [Ruminococcaceae bacterium]|nr:hypothetical protein [Oscillospiraceae bacterium]
MRSGNRRGKRIVGIAAVSCVVWSAVFLTDYTRCENGKTPFFAVEISHTGEGKTTFIGPGYKIVSEDADEGASVTMTMFGKVISSSTE